LRSTYAEELHAAEEKAKTAGTKIWEGYSAEMEAEAQAARSAAAAAEMEPIPDSQKQVVELNLTEIKDGTHFFAQVAADTAVGVLQEQIAAACRLTTDSSYDPGPGTVCCARFTVDDEWYRARVKSRSGGEYTVYFIDYGNTDVVGRDRLKPLDPSLSPQAVSPQAVECRLAYLIVGDVDDTDDGREAAQTLGETAWGKPMLARVEDREAGVLLVTLFDDAQLNINELLITEGLARVDKKPPKRAAPLVKGLYEKELVAKTKHIGMWIHGDIEEEDAPEFGARKPPPVVGTNPWKK
jgi:staphylococcal nuclease domain-containing protein 1